MRKYMSTGYAWIPDNDNIEKAQLHIYTLKTQLHIYTFDNEDEWIEADAALVDFNAKQEYLSNLGYVSDPIPVKSIAGATYTFYNMHLAGDFLIIEETVIIDV